SLSQLLDDIGAQRQQAVQLARLVEQDSLSQTPARGRRRPSNSKESPPKSFLDDYARDFVDNYRPIRQPVRIFGRATRRRKPHQIRREPRQQQTETLSEQHGSDGRSNEDEQHIMDDCSTEEDGQRDAAQHLGADDCWVSKIDRNARTNLWNRFSDPGVPGTPEERRIIELVRRAELTTTFEPPAAPPPTSPALPSVSLPAVTQPGLQNHILWLQTPGQQPLLQCWSEDEWHRWAAFVCTADDALMHRRLDWVHEQQTDAWQHGFRDHILPNGKLCRTYRNLPLELHAYPDGNIKRTACVVYAGKECSATTLFFSNGDWQCSISGGLGERERLYFYYYCEERVWSRQDANGCVEYRYDDGRVERIDRNGTTTVTHPSGEVVVCLSDTLCSGHERI
ncbi:hypothetical protein J3B02_005594, partial [Coemansia erecta]